MSSTLISLRPETEAAIGSFRKALEATIGLEPRHYELASIAATAQLGCSG